ncbi:arf-GAP domain and FG repeat-containing protein 1 isoform X1 [Chironomus tepperi]|uniref:arf-GAP domain and FG repeat-containing protein 1 isoform X1 n=1 Tax=Chironomus tepperi TaxID=113505 RepID=UPI00391F6433
MLKPKQDNDKMLKTLREIVSSGSNRQCFDCGQRGVTYVNMTIGSFVCTSCSGVLRGLTPPHRVKSISMATFTSDELDFIKTHGNDESAKTWLGLWDSKRTLKQEHRDFMIDKYERKRYYLEPASPLKSINTSSSSSSVATSTIQQSSNGISKSIGNHHSSDSNNLTVLKLTPPAANNRHHHQRTQQNHNIQNGHLEMNGNSHNNINSNNLNGKTSQNGSIKSDNSCNDFVADFSKASIYNSNNSLNSTGSAGQINGKTVINGFKENITSESDLNANFADFENNKIYNAAEEYCKNNNTSINSPNSNSSNIQWNIWQHFQWPNNSNQSEQNRWSLPMSTSSLSNNSLNSSSGTFNSNSSLNSTTPSADRYAALKDLDEQLREAKVVNETVEQTNPSATSAIPVNPFKNPFQAIPQQQTNQQSYQNWTMPESQNFLSNGFGSPLNSNGFSNGFFYANNMSNGIISQSSSFGGKAAFANPFMTTGTTTASTNNPFL